MSDGLDITELTEFSEKFTKTMSKKYPKEVKKFLRSEGNKLKRHVKSNAKACIGQKTGNYMKGWQRGKPYKYNVDEDAIRVYNNMPHAHLLENGHRIVTKKTKREVGFKSGTHVVEKTSKNFENEFAKDIENWVDEMLKEGY